MGDEGSFERKADIFYKRTIKPHTPVTSVDTPPVKHSALFLWAEKARVDMDYMCELTGKTEEEIFRGLEGRYLSEPDVRVRKFYAGKVSDGRRIPLRQCPGKARYSPPRKSAELYPEDYTVNVEALELVQPKELTASDICCCGLLPPRLPTEIVEQFMFQFLGTPRYAQWNIKVHFSALYRRVEY